MPAYTPLIKTKIAIPPKRPNAIARTRLRELMSEASKLPLTLISAPAGFGKTTLVVNWVHEAERASRTAWLSLDEGDSDPVNFVYYLIAALQTVEPEVVRVPISLLGSTRMPAPTDLMSLLLNEVAGTAAPILLVLDDYHCVRSPEVHAALGFFIERLTPSLRVVIVTREEPVLPLARWRSLQKLSEIGPEQLRFTYDEVVAFFQHTMGMNIDAGSARTLEDRTEGWVAALQLAALSLRAHGDEAAAEMARKVAAFSGRHRYLADYLASEVLSRQPEDVRSFLRQTAILHRLCAPLCDELTGRADSQALLARLEQANMFLIRLDDERQWYRYHALFAEYLSRALSLEEQRALHLKASAWYEGQGIGEDAIRHALAAGAYDTAVRLVRTQAERTLARGELPTVVSWLRQLPDEVLRDHADLAGYRAWLLYMSGHSAEAETYASMADRRDVGGPNEGRLSVLLALRAFLALNWADPRDAVPLAQRALRTVSESDSFFHIYTLCLLGQAQALTGMPREAVATLRGVVDRAPRLGNHLMAFDAMGHLALMLPGQGQLREAIALCRNATEAHVDAAQNPLPLTGLVAIPLGTLYFETNDLEAAELSLRTGIRLCHALGMSYFRLVGLCTLARLQHCRGEHDRAWSTLAEAREATGRPESPRRCRIVWMTTVELHLREGNVEAARRAMEYARQWAASPWEPESIAQVRLLLAQKNPAAAARQLAALEEAAQRQQSYGSLITLYVLQSACRRALGQMPAAAELVGKAISLAAAGGYRRIFLDEMATLRPLLEQVRHVAPAFVKSLLAPPMESPHLAAAVLPDGLTRIEHEMLILLNRGLTNQEIATELAMTVSTAKWRMNQIFGKLQVRNRVEALVRARELHLL